MDRENDCKTLRKCKVEGRIDLIEKRISYIAVEGRASNKEPAATNATVRVREQISVAILYGDLP